MQKKRFFCVFQYPSCDIAIAYVYIIRTTIDMKFRLMTIRKEHVLLANRKK